MAGISFAPEFRLMLTALVGPRTLDTAKEVVAVTSTVRGYLGVLQRRLHVLSGGPIAAFHVVTTFARTGKRGRPRTPHCEPDPDLAYGQLVNQKHQGKLLHGQHVWPDIDTGWVYRWPLAAHLWHAS